MYICAYAYVRLRVHANMCAFVRFFQKKEFAPVDMKLKILLKSIFWDFHFARFAIGLIFFFGRKTICSILKYCIMPTKKKLLILIILMMMMILIIIIIIIIVIVIITVMMIITIIINLPETRKYWVDVQRGIISSHWERNLL